VIPVVFTSWLAPHLRTFVALKHAGGCDYRSEEKLLLRFDQHVRREVKPPLSRSDLLAYMESKDHLVRPPVRSAPLSPASRPPAAGVGRDGLRDALG